MLQATNHATRPIPDDKAFWLLMVSVTTSPLLLLALTFGTAFTITQILIPGTSGSEALVLSAVLVGLAGGFLLSKLNSDYALNAPVYAASFTSLLYFSLRLFWFNAPLTLAAAGFLLIIPAALLGAVAATRLGANQAAHQRAKGSGL